MRSYVSSRILGRANSAALIELSLLELLHLAVYPSEPARERHVSVWLFRRPNV